MYRIFTLFTVIGCLAFITANAQGDNPKQNSAQFSELEKAELISKIDKNSAEYHLANVYTDISYLLEGKSLAKDKAKVEYFMSSYDKLKTREIEDDKFAHLMYLRIKATDIGESSEDYTLIILDYFLDNREIGNTALFADKRSFITNYMALALENIQDRKMSEEMKRERSMLDEEGATRETYKDLYKESIDETIAAVRADKTKMALYNGIVEFHKNHNVLE